jgi:hypothetical protein
LPGQGPFFVSPSRWSPVAKPSRLMDLTNLLRVAITRASESFVKDELAFLALTSKVERPFLDRVAFQLHRGMESSGTVVAREYPVFVGVRADIAILRAGDLIGAIEGKAMYTADCLTGRGLGPEYPKRMHADLQRYATTQNDGLQVFTLLVATNPGTQVPESLQSIIKYSRLVNRGFQIHSSALELERIAGEYLEAQISAQVTIANGKLDAGKAFEIPVALLWWLYGPFSGQAGWAILRSGAA